MSMVKNRFGCRVEDHPQIARRSLLQVGGMSLIGMGLGDLLRLEAQAATAPDVRPGTAKSVVFIFQSGGPSQHETFDPKPEATDTIRGEYGVIPTRTPGEVFCEYLPKLAARSDRFSIVRTMHHIAGREFRNEHNSCHYLLHTGSTALPAGDTNASIVQPRSGRIIWPSIGSMIAYAAPTSPEVGLPAMIELPRASQMKYPGRESGCSVLNTIGSDWIWQLLAERKADLVQIVFGMPIRISIQSDCQGNHGLGGTIPVAVSRTFVYLNLVRQKASTYRKSRIALRCSDNLTTYEEILIFSHERFRRSLGTRTGCKRCGSYLRPAQASRVPSISRRKPTARAICTVVVSGGRAY